MNGPFIIHWLPLITHDAAQLGFTNLFSWHIWGWNHDAATDYAGVQLVTRQLCLENYLHIANALCWQSPAAFTVWCINHVDRLTCSRCDTLRNNIIKQLLKNQLDITWRWVPSTPRKVQNSSCQEIEQCTKQMNQMNVGSVFDCGRLDAQTSQTGLVQQQCFCKDIQLMKISESRKGWNIESGVTIQFEHRQGRCLSCE